MEIFFIAGDQNFIGRLLPITFLVVALPGELRSERVNTERVEMAEVQGEDDEFPRHRDRGDRDIRETWMPAGGLRGIAQRTRDPCRGKIEREKAVRIVVEDAIEPSAQIPGALAEPVR